MCRSKELCLDEMSIVRVFDLSNNNLSGTINTTFSIGNSLRVISLIENKFTGKVPRALIDCKYLTLLDLGNNQLNDTFPNWLGYPFYLKYLGLDQISYMVPLNIQGIETCFCNFKLWIYHPMDLVGISFGELSGYEEI